MYIQYRKKKIQVKLGSSEEQNVVDIQDNFVNRQTCTRSYTTYTINHDQVNLRLYVLIKDNK